MKKAFSNNDLDVANRTVQAMSNELKNISSDKKGFLDKLMKKKKILEMKLNEFFGSLEINIRKEYNQRVNKLKEKIIEVEEFIREGGDYNTEDLKLSVQQSRHFRLVIEENLKYRQLLRGYTAHQLTKVDDLSMSLEMFKDIIMPKIDQDLRLSSIRKKIDEEDIHHAEYKASNQYPPTTTLGSGLNPERHGHENLVNINTFDESVQYFPHQKTIDKYRKQENEYGGHERNAPDSPANHDQNVLIDFDKIEKESAMYNLKAIKMNLLNERQSKPVVNQNTSYGNVLSNSFIAGSTSYHKIDPIANNLYKDVQKGSPRNSGTNNVYGSTNKSSRYSGGVIDGGIGYKSRNMSNNLKAGRLLGGQANPFDSDSNSNNQIASSIQKKIGVQKKQVHFKTQGNTSTEVRHGSTSNKKQHLLKIMNLSENNKEQARSSQEKEKQQFNNNDNKHVPNKDLFGYIDKGIMKNKIFGTDEDREILQKKKYENKELIYDKLVPSSIRNSNLRNRGGSNGVYSNLQELKIDEAIEGVVEMSAKRRMMKQRLNLDTTIYIPNKNTDKDSHRRVSSLQTKPCDNIQDESMVKTNAKKSRRRQNQNDTWVAIDKNINKRKSEYMGQESDYNDDSYIISNTNNNLSKLDVLKNNDMRCKMKMKNLLNLNCGDRNESDD